MVPVFMILWLFGGWLTLMCSVLIWTERVRFFQRVAICGKCGYDLQGLGLYARCPECNAPDRKLEPVGRAVHGVQTLALLWLIPTVSACLLGFPACLLLGLFGNQANLFIAVSVATFAGWSTLIHALVAWLPARAPVRLAIFGTAAMLAAQFALGRIIVGENQKFDIGLQALVPVLVWPFCGFGLAALTAISGHRSRRRLG